MPAFTMSILDRVIMQEKASKLERSSKTIQKTLFAKFLFRNYVILHIQNPREYIKWTIRANKYIHLCLALIQLWSVSTVACTLYIFGKVEQTIPALPISLFFSFPFWGKGWGRRGRYGGRLKAMK